MMRPPSPNVLFSAACVSPRNTPWRNVDVDHAVHLLQRGLLEGLRKACAGIVHQDIQSTEGRGSLVDRSRDGLGIGGIRLDRNRVSPSAFNLFHDRGGCVSAFGVGINGHARSVRCQPLGNCRANPSRSSSNQCDLARQFLSIVSAHMFVLSWSGCLVVRFAPCRHQRTVRCL